MAVISTKIQGQSGTYEAGFQRSYVQNYLAIVDDPEDIAKTVLDAFLPIGTLWIDGDATLLRKTANQRPPPHTNQWDVSLLWAIQEFQEVEETVPDRDLKAPVDRQRIVTMQSQLFQVEAETEFVLNIEEPLRNTAGDKFDPLPRKDFASQILTIRENRTSDPSDLFDTHLNHLNAAAFRNKPAQTWKLNQINSIERQAGGVKYWDCTFVFAFDKNFHQFQADENGYYYIDTGTMARTPFTDAATGSKERVPQLLTAGGGDGRGGDPVPKLAILYETADFSIFDET
ncbi:MAG: hypothetical protein GTO41_19995 [Burkholderiales bacterium]|nr:hypothetical protein [Burkholderiales bacterium]